MNYIQYSSVKITVTGQVQGVGYRYFISGIAREIGLLGYAKNLISGEVEIIAEGRKEFLDALIEKAASGPEGAKVKTCKVEWLDFKKKYDNFEVL